MSKSVPPSSRPRAGISSGSGNRLIEAWSSLDKAEELRKTGHHAEAKSICGQLLRLYPDYVGALHTFGLILAEMGEHAAAISHLSTAVALNPRDWKILTALSGCYIHIGAHEMAVRMLEQAQRLKPRDPAILLCLAKSIVRNANMIVGPKPFKEAFALDGSMQSALLGRAALHARGRCS